MCTRLQTAVRATVLLLGASLASAATTTDLRPRDQGPADDFGAACAISGDLLVVGDPATATATVFGRVSGRWTQRQRIASPEVAGGDGFGAAVAVHGERILVGAPDATGGRGAGYVYDFDRTRSSWALTQALDADARGSELALGAAVALDDTHLVLGAPGEGAVYVFAETLPSVWSQSSRVAPLGELVADRFGASLDVDAAVMAVGAPSRNFGDGAVHVYHRSGRNWVEDLAFEAPGGTGGSLGSAVSLDDATLLAGEPGALAVRTFRNGNTGWKPAETLTFPAGVEFGARVAVSGDLAAVADPTDGSLAGRVHLFRRAGTRFAEFDVLTPEADVGGFGSGLDIDSGVVAIGGSGAHLFTGFAQLVEVSERLSGYLLPTAVRYVPSASKPSASKPSPSKPSPSKPSPSKKAQPGIAFDAALDLGQQAVDVTGAATIQIGGVGVFVPGLTQKKTGKPATYSGEGIDVRLTPDKAGSSRASLRVTYSGDLSAAGIDPDGALRLAYSVGDLTAEGTVVLSGGAFTLAGSPSAVVAPAVALDRLVVKAKGVGKSAFAFTARFPTDGAAPGEGPNVVVRYGDDFEQRIDGSRFKVKGTKARFSDGKAEGVTKIIVDFRKGLVKVAAKRLDIVRPGVGPQAVSVGVSVNALGGDVLTTAAVKGTKLLR